MREHAAGLLKHSKNVTWYNTGGGVRTIHHRTGLFFHMTTHFNGAAISRQAVSMGGNFCAIFELRHTIFEILAKM